MQRTAPSTPPRRQENYEGSPALMMASRIRAEQGPEKAAQYLSAMEPFLAPGERTHISYTLGLPIPQPVQQNYGQQPQGMGGGFGGMPNMQNIPNMGGMGGLGNIGGIMQVMQLMNTLQGAGGGGQNPIMNMLGGLMGGKKPQ